MDIQPVRISYNRLFDEVFILFSFHFIQPDHIGSKTRLL